MTEQFHFIFSLSCIGEGNGNPLQCSCLENPRDGGAWWAAVYGVAQSWTWLKRLSSSSSSWPPLSLMASLKALYPSIVSLRVRVSTHKFWEIQFSSLQVLNSASWLILHISWKISHLPVSTFPSPLSDILGDPFASLYFYTVSVLFNPRWHGTSLISKSLFLWLNNSLRPYLSSCWGLNKRFCCHTLSFISRPTANIMSLVF